MAITSALLAAAASGAATGGSAVRGRRAQKRQMDFQREMSNTAYRRSVVDMRAAGLNPALMFGSGSAASSPSGAGLPPVDFGAPVEDALSAFQKAQEKRRTDSQVTLQNAQAASARAAARLTDSQNEAVRAELPRKQIQEKVFGTVLGGIERFFTPTAEANSAWRKMMEEAVKGDPRKKRREPFTKRSQAR